MTKYGTGIAAAAGLAAAGRLAHKYMHGRKRGSKQAKGQRKRRKTGRSITKTKRKVKAKFHTDDIPSGVEGARQKIYWPRARKQRRHRKGGHFQYHDNYGVSISNKTGTAACNTIDYIGLTTDFIDDISTAAFALGYCQPGLFALDPNCKTTQSSAAGTRGAGNISQQAIFLREVDASYDIHNATNIGQEVDIWFCMAKNNDPVTKDILTQWSNANINEAAPLYNSAAVQPVVAALNATAGYGSPYFITTSPFEFTDVRRKWRKMHHRNFHLAGKSTVSLDVRYVVNQLVTRDYLAQIATDTGVNQSFVKNLSVQVIIKSRAMPVFDNNAGVLQVTSGAPELLITCHRKFKGYLAGYDEKYRIEADCPFLVYNAALADTRDINIVDVNAAEVEIF